MTDGTKIHEQECMPAAELREILTEASKEARDIELTPHPYEILKTSELERLGREVLGRAGPVIDQLRMVRGAGGLCEALERYLNFGQVPKALMLLDRWEDHRAGRMRNIHHGSGNIIVNNGGTVNAPVNVPGASGPVSPGEPAPDGGQATAAEAEIDGEAAAAAGSGTASVELPSSDCYGEVDHTEEGGVLRVLMLRSGAGRRPEVCEPIALKPAQMAILLDGLERAQEDFIRGNQATAAGIGVSVDASEVVPPEEKTYFLRWDTDDLERLMPEAGRKSRNAALSKVRNLVRFADGAGLITSDGSEIRYATIRMRIRHG
jgi:hypothetical protein